MKYAIAALSLITFVGCQPNDQPTEEDYDDVASAVSLLVTNDSGGEVGSMEDGVDLALGEESDLTSMGSGSYQGTFGSFMYEYNITCSDTAGTVGPCGPGTNSANLIVDWNGELDLARFFGAVDRTGNWTLSDIQSNMVKFNGDGTFDVQTEFTSWIGNRKRTFNLDYDANYNNVTYDRSQDLLVDGTMTYNVHAERTRERNGKDVDAEFEMTVVVTFDGSGNAIITIDKDRSWTLNLGNGAVTRQ